MRRASRWTGTVAVVGWVASSCMATGSTTGTSTRPQPRSSGGYDLVIEGGRVVDGTGAAWFYGDLAIQDDRIVRIAPPGMLRSVAARDRIDATGLVVAPGFIDIQGQSQSQTLRGDGRLISKVTQGVTTEILGEGSTMAPVNDRIIEAGGVRDSAAVARLRRFEGPRGFDAWLRAIEAHGVSANIGSFVGASTIRTYGRGLAMGPASQAEMEEMQEAVRNAMRDGAFGLASALIYPPGNFATTEELTLLGRAMAPFGGLYITHMRSEADRLLEAIDEAIEIGRRGGVPVEIFHLKAAGKRNFPKMRAAIAKIDSARAAGLDVQADMYPYAAAGTGLTACFPPWVSADGRLLQNLRDPRVRQRIREEIRSNDGSWENLCDLATPEGVMLLGFEREGNRGLMGRRLADVAKMMGSDWIDTAMDLVLSEEQRIGTVYFMMDEDNVRLGLQQPWIKIGTDASGVDPDAETGLVHPRAYGTFPRILGRYVREEGLLTLEDAVRKMSSAVSTRLRIPDRGVLAEGWYADVVVFDPETVGDRATFEEPHQLSTGVLHVLVNGVPVVRDGSHTGATPGRALRGPGWTGRR
ncbi:MAG: D-aminoacylase [Gemmatimonadota bacterium]